ncbi:MAG: hypothetical protein ACYTXA_28550 [Nostoc sp.]
MLLITHLSRADSDACGGSWSDDRIINLVNSFPYYFQSKDEVSTPLSRKDKFHDLRTRGASSRYGNPSFKLWGSPIYIFGVQADLIWIEFP